MTTQNKNTNIMVGSCVLDLSKSPQEKKDQLLHNLKVSIGKSTDSDDFMFFLLTPEILDSINDQDMRDLKHLKNTLQKTLNKLNTILEA